MAALPVGEVFPHPTVKQVVFQIRFPKLFFLNDKVGEFQLAVMDRFPKSELQVRRAIVFAQGGEEAIKQMIDEGREDDATERIWVFSNDAGVTLEVKLDSLTILSTKHKSYRHGDDNFRATASTVVERFLRLAPIPTVDRLGFRYTDECPFPALTNDAFQQYFSSVLPAGRFSVENCTELVTRAVVKRGEDKIRYVEAIVVRDSGPSLLIDMDAFAENVPAAQIMEKTDKLHDIIRQEFEASIREPVLEYMRTGRLAP